LTIFQVPDAAGDPLTRWPAIFSLICALMSLTYGCTYIVQFGSMRSMYKASRWAEESQKTKTVIWWNVWVMLAIPAIWLAWSMIAFCIAILSFVWRTGATTDPPDGNRPQLSPAAAVIIRVIVTFIFGLGVVHFIMIVRTFGTYGARERGRGSRFLRGRAAAQRSDGDAQRAAEGHRRLETVDELLQLTRVQTNDSEKARELRDTAGRPGLGLGLSGVTGVPSGSFAAMNNDGTTSEEAFTAEVTRGRGKVSPKL